MKTTEVYYEDINGMRLSLEKVSHSHYVLKDGEDNEFAIKFPKPFQIGHRNGLLTVFWLGASNNFPFAEGSAVREGYLPIFALYHALIDNECGGLAADEITFVEKDGNLRIERPIFQTGLSALLFNVSNLN